MKAIVSVSEYIHSHRRIYRVWCAEAACFALYVMTSYSNTSWTPITLLLLLRLTLLAVVASVSLTTEHFAAQSRVEIWIAHFSLMIRSASLKCKLLYFTVTPGSHTAQNSTLH